MRPYKHSSAARSAEQDTEQTSCATSGLTRIHALLGNARPPPPAPAYINRRAAVVRQIRLRPKRATHHEHTRGDKGGSQSDDDGCVAGTERASQEEPAATTRTSSPSTSPRRSSRPGATRSLDEQRLVEHLNARSSPELFEASHRRAILCNAGLRPYSRKARASRPFCKAFPVT
ncbi:unnamed protein product [Trichogramma brassicae]|uniref:Uncharacterized protein n=1 Tax=Trichogramma brassicae TaxID=86971 RepID=A0A6H5J3P9_9HYME|nr:unnamed protein product [Trichogramma brassicae]